MINVDADIPLTAWVQLTSRIWHRRTDDTDTRNPLLMVALVGGNDGYGWDLHVHSDIYGPGKPEDCVLAGFVPSIVSWPVAKMSATRALRRKVREIRGF